MKYKRLITFGDSFTYGHGLPDCFVAPYYPGDKPSKLGWVNILANKLNIDHVTNLSRPGASNRYILHSIINFNDFKEEDLIIIQPTYYSRDFFFRENNSPCFVGGWNLDPSNAEEVVKHWKYYLDRCDFENITRSYEHILNIVNYFKVKNINFHFLTTERLEVWDPHVYDSEQDTESLKEGLKSYNSNFIYHTIDTVKSYFTLENVFSEAWKYGDENQDYALDNSHLGLSTQEFCADRIIYYLNKYYNRGQVI